jgi:FkbM family methyltransferase
MSRVKLLLARVPGAYAWAHRCSTWARFALRRPSEPDFAAFALFGDRRGLFLDVGANIGQSALSFRRVHRTAPILSIEANPSLERDLRFLRRVVRRFDYRICAASDVTGRLTLHVPTYRGLALTGEASIDASEARAAFWTQQQQTSDSGIQLQATEVPSVRLDDLGLAPAFVKIDVEGCELQVLAGMSETLATHRPVILVERPEGREVHDFLAAIGYRPYVYVRREDRLAPDADESSQNVFFLSPAEALSVAGG